MWSSWEQFGEHMRTWWTQFGSVIGYFEFSQCRYEVFLLKIVHHHFWLGLTFLKSLGTYWSSHWVLIISPKLVFVLRVMNFLEMTIVIVFLLFKKMGVSKDFEWVLLINFLSWPNYLSNTSIPWLSLGNIYFGILLSFCLCMYNHQWFMKYFKLMKHHFSYRLHVEKVLLIDGLIINWLIENNVFPPSYGNIFELKRMGARVQNCSSWEKIHFFCYHIIIEEFITLKHPQLVSNLLWTSKIVIQATYWMVATLLSHKDSCSNS